MHKRQACAAPSLIWLAILGLHAIARWPHWWIRQAYTQTQLHWRQRDDGPLALLNSYSMSDMQTRDSESLFQTTSQLTAASNHALKAAATRSVGSPIHLSGKVLDFQILGNEAWTAESGWQARCLDLTVSFPDRQPYLGDQSGQTRRLYTGHRGPVTSIALKEIRPNDGAASWLAVFTGSWDKTIRVWDAEVSRTPGKHG